jgi:drug/metabolite transporter (DMT)-like permease
MTGQNRAYVFALLAVLCWSTVASAFKLTLREVDYLTLLLFASLTSTVLLLLAIVLQGKTLLLKQSFLGERAEASHRDKALLRSAANGFLNPFLYYVILFKAYSLLPAQEAQPLNYTWPLMIVLLSAPMLGQRIRPLSIAALGLSFLGVLIISTHGDLLAMRFTNLPGALLAMGSAVVWALFWLTNVKDRRDELVKLFLNFLFGFVYILATMLVLASLSTRYNFPPRVSTSGFLGCAYVGVFEMGLAFILWLKALQLTETTARVSNLIFLSPFVSLIFIRFVVGEAILPSSVVGLAAIAGGILIQRRVRAELA